jgi:hypothetical protein
MAELGDGVVSKKSKKPIPSKIRNTAVMAEEMSKVSAFMLSDNRTRKEFINLP